MAKPKKPTMMTGLEGFKPPPMKGFSFEERSFAARREQAHIAEINNLIKQWMDAEVAGGAIKVGGRTINATEFKSKIDAAVQSTHHTHPLAYRELRRKVEQLELAKFAMQQYMDQIGRLQSSIEYLEKAKGSAEKKFKEGKLPKGFKENLKKFMQSFWKGEASWPIGTKGKEWTKQFKGIPKGASPKEIAELIDKQKLALAAMQKEFDNFKKSLK